MLNDPSIFLVPSRVTQRTRRIIVNIQLEGLIPPALQAHISVRTQNRLFKQCRIPLYKSQILSPSAVSLELARIVTIGFTLDYRKAWVKGPSEIQPYTTRRTQNVHTAIFSACGGHAESDACGTSLPPPLSTYLKTVRLIAVFLSQNRWYWEDL